MPINNILSVMQHGILSNEKAKLKKHSSVALFEVQERREIKFVPYGLKLHQYANVYFDARNPMMYLRRDDACDLCVLKISCDILNIIDVVIADKNASSEYVRFYDSKNGLENLNYDLIYAEYWTDNDYYEYYKKKSIKCAEILVPYNIPYDYILSAAVVDEHAKNKLLQCSFNKPIFIQPKLFFKG